MSASAVRRFLFRRTRNVTVIEWLLLTGQCSAAELDKEGGEEGRGKREVASGVS